VPFRLNDAIARLDIQAGTVQIVGAVERLAIAYYRQDLKEPVTPRHLFGHRFTLCRGDPPRPSSGTGSPGEGQPFKHMHR
jgi:hypothetical protein